MVVEVVGRMGGGALMLGGTEYGGEGGEGGGGRGCAPRPALFVREQRCTELFSIYTQREKCTHIFSRTAGMGVTHPNPPHPTPPHQPTP